MNVRVSFHCSRMISTISGFSSFVLLLLALSNLALGQTSSAKPASQIVMIQGSVEVMKAGSGKWLPATPKQFLQPGDRVRTGERSRAEIYLSNGMTIQKGELSDIEIPPGAGPTFRRGIFKAFNRDPAGKSELGLPNTATAAIRGTDFLVRVGDDGTSEVTVLDGEVVLKNPQGEVLLGRNERGVAQQGRPPTKSPVIEAVNDLIQWNLYYPAVIDVPEFGLSLDERLALTNSLTAYTSGDLGRALDLYPWARANVSEAESFYRAALLLTVGQVDKANVALSSARGASAARALTRLIEAVKFVINSPPRKPVTASEWLAESYYEQSHARLEAARNAARVATVTAPEFGFAWARLAELEFSFGRRAEASAALERSLRLSPRNAQALALKGFLLAAENKTAAALSQFDEAIAVDAALGNAWLGRGLCSIHAGRTGDGLRDLTVAASLEPQRGILRSYLGKAFANAGDLTHAEKELRLAVELDPRDPTPWLYWALLRQQQHRFNEGISDLEFSQELNDNRQLYRSRQLLDQDHAVRSANLAHLYLDAGLGEVSVREAARAVGYDYANYSAHLFLADSYDALRDPARFNLRYETVWFNELLLANILSPVGGGRLSQGIAALEYSRLFEADGLKLASSTTVRSDGMLHERASQFGTVGNTAYAFDLDYQHHNGVRPNNQLESIEWYTTVKHQITPQDSALFLVKYEDYHSGDNFQYYNPLQARRHFQFDEKQDPILVGAWHHEWAPGVHTMFLGARLINEQRFSDRNVPQIILLEDGNGTVVGRDSTGVDVNYRSKFEIYSAELNQVFDWNWVTLSAGARYQSGKFQTRNLLTNPTSVPFLLNNPPAQSLTKDDFERLTGYGYLTVKPVEQLRLIGGLAYDQETIPRNFRHPPVTPGEDDRAHVGPKAALIWTPAPEATVRGIYTRSLGGVSLDESYRLEPTQLAGFPQAFRTLISESTPGVGSVSAPTYETFGLAVDLKLNSRTYAGIQVERLTSAVRRRIGVFTAQNGGIPVTPDSIAESLNYVENALTVSVNQLIGDEFVAGVSYKLTHAELDDAYPRTPAAVLTPANPSSRATLHEAGAYLLFNHPSGFFARAEVHWYAQQNSGYSPALPGDDFFQENFYVGYRFPRSHGELRLGILNLAGGNYRLNPLTTYLELPRARVFEVRLNFLF